MTNQTISHAYRSLEEMVARSAEALRPPERLTVPEAAEKYRRISNTGGGIVGKFTHENTWYTVEVLETLTSDEFEGVVFVTSAQASKTEGVLEWVTHSVICDPADLMIVAPTHEAGRYFSKSRLTKLWLDTPKIREYMFPGKQSKNVFDISFKNGMLLTVSHPSIGELRGKPIPRLWLTDYDAMPLDVDGEGAPFDLARARTTTFGRFSMVVAESTPGHEVTNPKWLANSPHEAPPADGIMSLYNRGDRRRWFWHCPECSVPFEPDFKLLRWPDEGDDVMKADNVKMECPHCNHQFDESKKQSLNKKGRWVRDGQRLTKEGKIVGVPYRSNIASFWMKGVAAGFLTWRTIILDYLKAENDFDRTGNEQALKVFYNTRLGEPYVPQALLAERLPEALKARAEDWGGDATDPVVPEGVRYLMATVDVQAGMKSAFVVHVYGFGVGGDVWHIDMFKIRKSRRTDDDGDAQIIDPAAYPEDWQILVDKVIEKTYPLGDGSGRHMQIKLVGCDSGGKDGVTTNAYNFWRWLKNEDERGYHKRFQLLKGEPSKSAPRYKISYPDAQRKDRKAGARGDVPVGFINSNTQKDTAHAMLGRTEAGGGMVHFPTWAEDWLYTQLTSEIRTPKGWESTSKRRNEAFDLLYYVISLQIDPRIRGEQIDWADPPNWAEEWDKNDLVIASANAGGLVKAKRSLKSFEDLGRALT